MHGAAEAVWERVAPLLPRFTVEVLRSVDSTNSELMRRARAGQAEPVLVGAQEQTAGRGRLGRPWHSAPGASLTFSIGLALYAVLLVWRFQALTARGYMPEISAAA